MRLFAYKDTKLNITQTIQWSLNILSVCSGMDAKCQEEKPLRENSFRVRDSECRTNAAPGRFVPRGVIATVIALIIILIILVIALGSLLGKARPPSRDEENKGKS